MEDKQKQIDELIEQYNKIQYKQICQDGRLVEQAFNLFHSINLAYKIDNVSSKKIMDWQRRYIKNTELTLELLDITEKIEVLQKEVKQS